MMTSRGASQAAFPLFTFRNRNGKKTETIRPQLGIFTSRNSRWRNFGNDGHFNVMRRYYNFGKFKPEYLVEGKAPIMIWCPSQSLVGSL